MPNVKKKLKIVHRKQRYSQSQSLVKRTNQNVEKIMFTWLETNKTTKQSKTLRFVQFIKNKVYHSGIDCSYYKPMFDCKKVGLKSVLSLFDRLSKIVREDDLKQC